MKNLARKNEEKKKEECKRVAIYIIIFTEANGRHKLSD